MLKRLLELSITRLLIPFSSEVNNKDNNCQSNKNQFYFAENKVECVFGIVAVNQKNNSTDCDVVQRKHNNQKNTLFENV